MKSNQDKIKELNAEIDKLTAKTNYKTPVTKKGHNIVYDEIRRKDDKIIKKSI